MRQKVDTLIRGGGRGDQESEVTAVRLAVIGLLAMPLWPQSSRLPRPHTPEPPLLRQRWPRAWCDVMEKA